MAYKNDLKLALLFIALGLLLGGISGMMQSPPPQSGEGWTNENGFNSEVFCIIPDMNNDRVNDIAVFINAWQWDTANESESRAELYKKYNETAGLQIISGSDGRVLRQIVFDEPYRVFRDMPLGMIYNNGSLLFTAVPRISFNWTLSNTAQHDFKSFQLIRFSLSEMQIAKKLNFTAIGLEDINQFNSTNMDPNGYFAPQCYFLKNKDLGYSIPGNPSYTGDVILYHNSFRLNDNNSLTRFSFIDPESLTIMSYVNTQEPFTNETSNVLMYNTNKCPVEGPLDELDAGKFYPFMSWFFQINQGEQKNYQPIYVSMTSINNLQNDSFCVMNGLNNESLGLSRSLPYDTRLILNMNNKSSIAGVTSYIRMTEQVNNSYQGKIDNQWSYGWATHEKIDVVSASRIDIFKINNGVANCTFSDTVNLQLMEQRNDKWGNTPLYGKTVVNVVPIRYFNDSNSETGCAIISSDFAQKYVTYDDGDFYPFLEYDISFITRNVTTGVYEPGEKYTYATGSTGNINIPITNNLIDMNVRSSFPVSYDTDLDGMTDVPLVGQLVNERLLLNTPEKSQTGPCVIMQSFNGNAFQANAYSLYIPMKVIFRSDVNKDLIPDMVLAGDITIFQSMTEIVEQSWPATQLEGKDKKDTRTFFIIGIVMIICAIVLIIIALTQKSPEHLKIRQKWILILLFAAIMMVLALLMNMNEISNYATRANTTQIGMTQKAISIANLARVGGIGTFAFLTLLPASVGIWILMTPIVADGIVGLNQIMFAKRAGLKAAVKKQKMDENAIIAETGSNYKILVIPPFGKKIEFKTVLSRAFSVLFLAVSIGLLVFENITVFIYDLTDLESISAITDKAFMDYINALFNLLILPGIISVAVFFWLIPTSWLLDDAGVLFYIKSVETREPEDVESIAGWFSDYLKGFLGISAIYSYGMFIWQSPMFTLYSKLPSEIANTIMVFVFGFIIFAGLAMGLLVAACYEITLPYSATRLYNRLAKRNVDVSMTAIEFVNKGKFSDEQSVEGFLGAQSVQTGSDSTPSPNKNLENQIPNRPNKDQSLNIPRNSPKTDSEGSSDIPTPPEPDPRDFPN